MQDNAPEPAIKPIVCMTDLNQRLLEDRERFVAFAFAGADLLLEAGTDGHIRFATGAARTYFDCEPSALLRRPAASLIAADDHAGFAACLELLGARGRVGPILLRLSNRRRTPCMLSGLTRPGPDGTVLSCLSFGPRATAASPAPAAGRSAAAFRRQAEQLLRTASRDPAASSTTLDLLEMSGGGLAGSSDTITATLLDHLGGGALASDLGSGRFALVRSAEAGAPASDLEAVVSGLEEALRAHRIDARIVGTERLTVGSDEPGQSGTFQAVRALRSALSIFARGGVSALSAAGFDGGLGGFVSAATARTAALRRILTERRFRLAFQPIVHLADRSVHHYEALLRLDLGGGGSPADFVTMAEMVGLAEELDWAVFQAVCDGALRTGATIAFNISGLSVQSPAFRTRLLDALDVPPLRGTSCLIAEVTETAEIEDEAAAAETIRALRDRKVPVCIDDFGAGAAAFRYLRSFGVDHVKIDGTYVRQAAENERDRGFVAAMVDLSLAVGAQTIAEQIESESVAKVMASLGVRYGQGWLFGRPGDLPTAGVTLR